MTIHQGLKHYFGFAHFRPGQESIVQNILDGHDVCAILPTGGGKSICFQLPAVLLPQPTIVISPLISLMRDQVAHLLARGIAAAALHSQISQSEQINILHQLCAGKIKLLYLSPERLQQKLFNFFIPQMKLSLLVIDEAHCISAWGHDFRPEYMQISNFVSKLNVRPKIAAFTASATPKVEQEIISSLQLHQPFIFRTSSARTNLSITVVPTQSNIVRVIYLIRLLRMFAGQKIIVYCQTRDMTQNLAGLINRHFPEIKAGYYHGRLDKEARYLRETEFGQNKYQVMLATTAFGMGIDLPDIRAVIHVGVPGSIEQYYQEIGRSGRDGLSAHTFLLTHPSDWDVALSLATSADPDTQRQNHHRLQKMSDFIHSKSCRMCLIADYFGDGSKTTCQKCDNCLTPQKTHPLVLFEKSSARLQLLQALCSSCHQLLTDQQMTWLSLFTPQTHQNLSQISGFGQRLTDQIWPIIEPIMIKYAHEI